MNGHNNRHKKIEYLRKELLKSGLEKGLLHKETILISKRLDRVMNKCAKVENKTAP